MTNLLVLPKWFDVLIGIYKVPESRRYCQKITREVKSSINYIRATVRILEKAKLIRIIPTKKIKKIYLTAKGKNVLSSVLNIKSAINENKL